MGLAVELAQRMGALDALARPAWPSGSDVLPAVAQAAVSDALDRGETHYTDRPGILPMRKAVADMLAARFGVKPEAKSDVVITCAATEARFVCLQELLKPGESVYAPSSPERITGAAIIRSLTVSAAPKGAKLAYLPASMGEAALKAALASLDAETIVVFEVDAEGGFHPAQVAGFGERTVTIGDLGVATGLASARIGFLAAPTTRAPALRDFKQALTICTTNLSQWAALAAMESK